jgi:hypothetical protein
MYKSEIWDPSHSPAAELSPVYLSLDQRVEVAQVGALLKKLIKCSAFCGSKLFWIMEATKQFDDFYKPRASQYWDLNPLLAR